MDPRSSGMGNSLHFGCALIRTALIRTRVEFASPAIENGTNFSYPDSSLIRRAKKGGVDAGVWIAEGPLYNKQTRRLHTNVTPRSLDAV